MQQADNEGTRFNRKDADREAILAEMDRKRASYPDIAGWLIGTGPSDTLGTCANVCRFIGSAVDGIEHNGSNLDHDKADAVSRIMDMVADVIQWEADRALYERKTEAEVEAREQTQ